MSVEEGVRYWTDLAQAEARDAAALRTRVAELEAQLSKAEASISELEAQAVKDDAHALVVNDAHLKKVAALRGRAEKAERRAEKAERFADQLCAVLGREVGNRGDSEGAVDVAERLIRERDEAVAALVSVEQTAARVADRSLEVFELRHEFRLVRLAARAVLAKYPEGR